MIVYRVDVQVRQERIDRALSLFRDLVHASRGTPGVVAFDILPDPETLGRFVSIEVYEDQAAADQQGELPELTTLMAELDDLLTGAPDGTVFHVSRTESWPELPASGELHTATICPGP